MSTLAYKESLPLSGKIRFDIIGAIKDSTRKGSSSMKRLSCEIVVLMATILSGGWAFADTINYVGTATLWKFSDNDITNAAN